LYTLLLLKSKLDDNELTNKYTCNNCNNVSESKIYIDKSINIKNTNIVNVLPSIPLLQHSKTIEESVSVDTLDELSLQDYKYVLDIFNQIQPKFTFSGYCNCVLCGSKAYYNLTSDELVPLILPISFIDLYKYEVCMKMDGYSLDEIMNMYPFELDIYKTITDNYKNPKE